MNPYIIRECLDTEVIGWLREMTLTDDPPIAEYLLEQADWFVAIHREQGYAGYGGVYQGIGDDFAELISAGVLPGHRGHGLQLRLIRRRLRVARDQGAAYVATHTAAYNIRSQANLIKAGFRPTLHEELDCGPDSGMVGFIHWQYDFAKRTH